MVCPNLGQIQQMNKKPLRHLLSLQDFTTKEIENLISKSLEIKMKIKKNSGLDSFLRQKTLAMVLDYWITLTLTLTLIGNPNPNQRNPNPNPNQRNPNPNELKRY